jgi:hypothetical protein
MQVAYIAAGFATTRLLMALATYALGKAVRS